MSDRPTNSYPADLPCRCAAYDPDHNAHVETQHTDCGGHGSERCGGCDGCLSMMASRAVNNAHTTRWRHMECENEPQHVQEFRNGIQGDYGPAAGERCEGCYRPTALYDWVEVVNDVNGEAAS